MGRRSLVALVPVSLPLDSPVITDAVVAVLSPALERLEEAIEAAEARDDVSDDNPALPGTGVSGRGKGAGIDIEDESRRRAGDEKR